MAFDKENDEKASIFTHVQQQNHNRYLDVLKQDFLRVYCNPESYDKSPKDFDQVKTIGCGSFGTVLLVREKHALTYHAMKVIEKSEIIKKKNIKQVYSEKRILQSANFPFLISLDFAFKDNLYIYMLLPYEAGGEIYTLIKKLGALSEPLVQFYSAQIVLALEYLHHCGVVHRDLKPENVFIGQSGFIKLGDFGFCKIIKTRTWTLCGTPEYIAPEIIKSKGYSYSVDWWSFGVLVYEMTAGYPPFYSSEPMKLYEKILAGSFKSPNVMTVNCKSLVKHLLEQNPVKRLGSLKAGIFDIKSHAYFCDVNWHNVLHQKIIPPFIPACKGGGGDTANFRDHSDIKLKKSSQCLYEEDFANF